MTQRYTALHKNWDHVGNLTPNFEHSPAIPGFNAPTQVAAWLPINDSANSVAMGFGARYDKKVEDYIVISSGKVVAPDRTNALVPAGVRINWAAAAAGDVVLTYTATDVAQRVTDLATGVFVTAATTYTKSVLAAALQRQGLLEPLEALEDFIGLPVGFAKLNFFLPAGSDVNNPTTWRFHNYKMQHKPTVLCKYVINLPWIPSSAHSTTVPTFSDAFVLGDLDSATGTGVVGSLATFQTQMDRYDNDTNANAVGLALTRMPCATHTSRTPITITSGATDITATVMLRQRSSVTALSQVGDWFFDAPVGVLWFYEAGADALPVSLTAADVVAYSDYTTVPASVTTYACVVGDLEPGCFLTYDGNSNLVARTAFAAGDIATASDGAPTDAELAVMLNQAVSAMDTTLGQVVGFYQHPRNALEKVRTAYRPGIGLGTLDAMPGTATKGMPDSVTYSQAADMTVIINLLNR